MIEIFSIISQLIIFLVFFSFPINLINYKYFTTNINLSIYDCFLINIFLILNFILFISFFNIDIFKVFIFILICSLIFNIIYLKEILKIKVHLSNKIFFLFFLILCLAFFFQLAENPKLEWDGVLHWLDKATNFYQNLPIQNFKNLVWQDYPHLGTYIWAIFWKSSFIQLEYYGRLFYIFFYVLAIISLTETFNIYNNKIIYKFFICLIIFLLTYDKFLFGGYQEYLIFASLVTIGKFIYLFNYPIKKSFFFLIIIILGGHLLMWFKKEGLFYFIIIMISILFIKQKNNSKKLILFSTILVVMNYFFIKKFIIGIDDTQLSFENLKIMYLFDAKLLFLRILMIVKFIIISFLKYPLWLLNLLILSLIFYKEKNFFNKNQWIIVFFILNFFFLFIIFLNTPLTILEFYLRVSLDRLLFQTSGFYLVLLAIFFNKYLKKTDE